MNNTVSVQITNGQGNPTTNGHIPNNNNRRPLLTHETAEEDPTQSLSDDGLSQLVQARNNRAITAEERRKALRHKTTLVIIASSLFTAGSAMDHIHRWYATPTSRPSTVGTVCFGIGALITATAAISGPDAITRTIEKTERMVAKTKDHVIEHQWKYGMLGSAMIGYVVLSRLEKMVTNFFLK